jgi:hypothetical protein
MTRRSRPLFLWAVRLALMAPLAAVLASCQGTSGAADPNAPGSLTGSVRLVREEADPAAPAGQTQAKRVETGDSLFGIQVFLGGTDRVARTDSSGRFRFDGLAPGSYEVMAERDGYASAHKPGLKVEPGQAVALEQLELLEKEAPGDDLALGSIRGKAVLGGDSPPAARIEVTAVGDQASAKTATTPAGGFLLTQLKPGSYTLYFRASTPGYAVATRTFEVFPGENALPDPVTLQLEGASDAEDETLPPAAVSEQVASVEGAESLYGSVVFAAPEAIRQRVYSVASLQLENAAVPRYAGFTEAGEFSFPALEPGRYKLTLQSEDIELIEPIEVEIRRGENTLLVLQARYLGEVPAEGEAPAEEIQPIEGGATLFGRVILADPSAAPSATVALGGSSLASKPDRDGNFRLQNVPPGVYDFFASAKGHVDYAEAIDVAGPGEIDLGEILLELDVEAPQVIATSPVDGTRDIPVDEVVPFTIEFDQPMDGRSAKAAISIRPNAAFALFMGSEAPNSSDRVLQGELYGFGAADALQHGQRYTLTVDASASSLEGVPMEQPFSFSFSTSKPAIIDSYPANGSSGAAISVNQHLLIYCNASIDPDRVNPRAVSIDPNRSGSEPILRVSTDARTGWGILEVSFPFEPDTNYKVSVNSRLRTASNQAFANTPFTISFRTGQLQTQTLDQVASYGRRVGRSVPNPPRSDGNRYRPEDDD